MQHFQAGRVLKTSLKNFGLPCQIFIDVLRTFLTNRQRHYHVNVTNFGDDEGSDVVNNLAVDDEKFNILSELVVDDEISVAVYDYIIDDKITCKF